MDEKIVPFGLDHQTIWLCWFPQWFSKEEQRTNFQLNKSTVERSAIPNSRKRRYLKVVWVLVKGDSCVSFQKAIVPTCQKNFAGNTNVFWTLNIYLFVWAKNNILIKLCSVQWIHWIKKDFNNDIQSSW